MKNKKPRRELSFDETVCLQRDSLDLYIDGKLAESTPINLTGNNKLKSIAREKMRSGILFQIKIRDSVVWESTPTQIED